MSFLLSPSRFGAAAGGGGATDPHFANVVFLSHFDGTDGATTATDQSNSGHTLTFNGGAQIDAAQKKFGAGSLLIGGVTDSFVSVPDSADWHLSSADSDQFTVECWVYTNAFAFSSRQYFLGQWNTGGGDRSWCFAFDEDLLRFYWSTTGSDFLFLNATSRDWVIIKTWTHLAVDKDSAGTLRVYVDGVMKESVASVGAFHDSAYTLNVGRDSNSGRELEGWIDGVRITKGVARYASDAGFTPPTAAYPDS